MANPAVTYIFVNGTAADATQVNTNFNDIINGLTDATKDLTVFAFTAASNVSFEANVALGNSSVDDIVFNGSLESTIPVGTNNSYDIGSSSLGLAGVYLGAAGGFTTRLVAQATASYTLSLPPTAGTSGYLPSNNGSGTLQWSPIQGAAGLNYSLAASVGSSALTIALKGADGNDPSSTNKVSIDFRNATAATGTPSFGASTAATSVVISSGSTLGHTSAVAEYIYVYAINNAGTIELAASSSPIWDEGSVLTTTAEGGAGAADSRTAIYSTTARSNVGAKLIGRLKSTQATAGTWASSITEISLLVPHRIGPYARVLLHSGNGHGSTNTKIRRYSTVVSTDDPLSLLTVTQSATNGDSVTLVKAGIYEAAVVDGATGSVASIGISKNSNQLTTNITGINISHFISTADSASGAQASTARTFIGFPGDVIRSHDSGAADLTTNVLSNFSVTLLALL